MSVFSLTRNVPKRGTHACVPYADKTWFSKHLAYTLQDVFKFFVFFMQKIFLSVLVFSLGISQSFAFTDSDTSWYKSFIEAASEQKYIQGYEDGSFQPEVKITREEFLKILFQVSEKELPSEETENCFSDVNSQMWSQKYICQAKKLEITQGYEDGTFRPYNTITTIEALAFIARMFEFEIGDTQTEWFENYRSFFNEKNIFEGHLFTKNTLLSRGQATELLVLSAKYEQEETLENISA